MPQRLASIALLVPDYDEALTFFRAIGFVCREDTRLDDEKRWVRVAPPNAGADILLARAVGERQRAAIGDQAGGRVWLFLETSDFDADVERLRRAGAVLEGAPRDEPYGRVVVWRDPWGNRWDLIQSLGAKAGPQA